MENILNKKFHLKFGQILAIINAPAGYLNKLNPLPEKTTIATKISKNSNFIQYFVSDIADLETALPICKKAVKEGGGIWITYPKQSSRVKTDLNRDISIPILNKHGFTAVSIISIDETWSAFRIKQVSGSLEKERSKQKKDNFKEYINTEKRIIIPPMDLQKKFKKNKKALESFNLLAFTNKKEYVQWILDAKRDETRKKRIAGVIEMLLKGLKNPSAKSGK